jgi:heme/copper-type cytochrome/quinol oxidase subunit 4
MQLPQEPVGESGTCCDWRKTVEDFEDHAQEYVRAEPVKAVGIAFVAGILLTILPVGRLVAALVRLSFVLIRPFLLILGAVKICEELQKRNSR